MLIGFVGLSGAGKSTAIDYLVAQGLGCCYYVGAVLVDEIARRGLKQTADTERIVRQALRSEHGMAVFAERALPQIFERCAREAVLLDAIYCPEERDCYKAALGDKLTVVAIAASFETRATRLENRPARPLSREMLLARDALERTQFRIDEVVAEATFALDNDGPLEEFEQALDGMRLKLF